MRRTAVPLMLILVLTVALVAPIVKGAEVVNEDFEATVDGLLQDRNIVLYNSSSGTVVTPSTITIQWSATLEFVIDRTYIGGATDHKIDAVFGRFSRKPPATITTSVGKIHVTWYPAIDASLDYVPFSIQTGTLNVVLKLLVYITASVNLEDVNGTGTVDLLNEIGPLTYTIYVNVSSESLNKIYSVTVATHLTGDLHLSFYRFRTLPGKAEVTGYEVTADLEDRGYIFVAPVTDLEVGACLDGPSGFLLSGTVKVFDPFGGEHEEPFSVSSGGCYTRKIEGVPLIPGNQTVTAYFMLGRLSVASSISTNVSGTSAMVATPLLGVVGAGGNWTLVASTSVRVVSSGESAPISVSITVLPYDLTCGDVFTETGQLECKWAPPPNLGNTTEVEVTVSTGSTSGSGRAVVPVINFGASSLGIVSSGIVALAQRGGSLLVVAGIAMEIVVLVASMLGRDIRLPVDPMRVVFAGVFLLLVVFGIPVLLSRALQFLPSVPSIGSGGVGEVVPIATAYYDVLLSKLKIDLFTWVIVPTRTDVVARIVGLVIIAGALTALAVVLMASMNAALPGQFLVPIISFAFSMIAVLISLAPTIGTATTLIYVVEGLAVVVSAIIAILVVFTVVGILVQTPGITAIAEDLAGAVVAYMLLVPVGGPLIYSFYTAVKGVVSSVLRTQALSLLTTKIAVGLGAVFIPPIDVLTVVTAYLVMASATVILMALVFVGPLVMAGPFAGIGVAIMRALRFR